jgi:DUF971 family protein
MAAHPVHLALEGNDLAIDWSDGRRLRYSAARLRHACPCAACNVARAQHAPLYDELAYPPGQLRIRRMTPAGNYAYHIAFSDGHDTGIYSLPLLARLGAPA